MTTLALVTLLAALPAAAMDFPEPQSRPVAPSAQDVCAEHPELLIAKLEAELTAAPAGVSGKVPFAFEKTNSASRFSNESPRGSYTAVFCEFVYRSGAMTLHITDSRTYWTAGSVDISYNVSMLAGETVWVSDWNVRTETPYIGTLKTVGVETKMTTVLFEVPAQKSTPTTLTVRRVQ